MQQPDAMSARPGSKSVLENRAILKLVAHVVVWLPTFSMLYDLAFDRLGMLPVQSLVYWTGVWATALLLLTLAITPVRYLLHWNAIVSVRRIVGLAALAYSVAHVIAYLIMHKWNFAFIVGEIVSRATLITATLSMLGLMALGATSTDSSVRRLGPSAWRRLHSGNMIYSGLALLHYLLSPGTFSLQFLMSGFFFWLCGWRVLAKGRSAPRVTALIGLGLISTILAALFEIGWLWGNKRIPPGETIEDMLNFEDGLPSSWMVLLVTMIVAAIGWYAGQRTHRGASPRQTPPAFEV